MIPLVFDNPEERGIDLMFDLENGMAITLFMTDESAQEMVNIVQNKLNARL
jgi:hypothetical protein